MSPFSWYSRSPSSVHLSWWTLLFRGSIESLYYLDWFPCDYSLYFLPPPNQGSCCVSLPSSTLSSIFSALFFPSFFIFFFFVFYLINFLSTTPFFICPRQKFLSCFFLATNKRLEGRVLWLCWTRSEWVYPLSFNTRFFLNLLYLRIWIECMRPRMEYWMEFSVLFFLVISVYFPTFIYVGFLYSCSARISFSWSCQSIFIHLYRRLCTTSRYLCWSSRGRYIYVHALFSLVLVSPSCCCICFSFLLYDCPSLFPFSLFVWLLSCSICIKVTWYFPIDL